MRLLTLSLTTAGVLALAPPALADTTVSLKSGTFGTALSGDYVFVTDTTSLFDEPMDVRIFRVGGQIRVTDAVGKIHARGGCTVVGAEARCSAAGLEGLRAEGSDKNDVLVNDTDLVGVMIGDHGNDDLFGGSNRDQMNGEAGNDDEFGGLGDDGFVLEDGTDRLDGQDGVDTVSYSAASVPVSITLGNTSVDDGPASERDRVLNVENASGGAQADSITGSDVRNILAGRGANDKIDGRGGDDAIDGGEGSDDLRGGEGTRDRVTYDDRAAGVTVTLNDVQGDGGPEDGATENVHGDVEVLDGGAGNDSLSGPVTEPAANLLRGNGGKDRLDGGAGDDTADGGEGDDTLIGDIGTDDYEGAGGVDLLDYSNRSGDFTEPLAVTLAQSFVLDGDDGGRSDGLDARDDARNIEHLTTGDGDDRMTGDDDDETFTPGLGADTVRAGAGRDVVHARDGVLDAVIDCGDGDQDFAEIDVFEFAQTVGCESIDASTN